MEVVYYQLLIVFSIVAVQFIASKYTIVICAMRTLFTLANLFYPPLIAIQLVVVWGSYFLLTANSAKNDKIGELENVLKALNDEERSYVEATSDEQKLVLSGREHLEFLQDKISTAQQDVIIFSGWLSSGIVNRNFLSLLESKLKSGCRIYIGFGYQNFSGEHVANAGLRRALNGLASLLKKYPNQIFVGKFPTHEKLLVVDDEFVVFGSNNWLSNSKFVNSDRSLVVYNSELAEFESERAKGLVGRNLITI